MNKLILWDFDGTLGYRTGNWEAAIFELTDDKIKKTEETLGMVSNMLQTGFPWHEPQKNFVSIIHRTDWWEFVKPRFVAIFRALGYGMDEAIAKAALIPEQYGRFDKWKLYQDAIPGLQEVSRQNWKNVLVTNNIPEFPAILKRLHIETFFEAVFVSALTGFNKPNPLILNGLLDTIPKNSKIVVVGDRVESDLVFANEIHAEGILVRSEIKTQSLSFANLTGLTHYLLSINM